MMRKVILMMLAGVAIGGLASGPAMAEGASGLLNMISTARPAGMQIKPVTNPSAFRQVNASTPSDEQAAKDHMARNAQLRVKRAEESRAEQARIDAPIIAGAAALNAKAAAEQSEYYKRLAQQTSSQLALPGAAANGMQATAPGQGTPAATGTEPRRTMVFTKPKAQGAEKPVRLFNTRKKETAE